MQLQPLVDSLNGPCMFTPEPPPILHAAMPSVGLESSGTLRRAAVECKHKYVDETVVAGPAGHLKRHSFSDNF